MIPVSITATREAAERVYGGPASLPAGWTLDTTFGLGGSGQASGPTGGYVYALKTNGVDDHYRVALGNRFEPSPDRTPAETGGNVECPRFFPVRFFPVDA